MRCHPCIPRKPVKNLDDLRDTYAGCVDLAPRISGCRQQIDWRAPGTLRRQPCESNIARNTQFINVEFDGWPEYPLRMRAYCIHQRSTCVAATWRFIPTLGQGRQRNQNQGENQKNATHRTHFLHPLARSNNSACLWLRPARTGRPDWRQQPAFGANMHQPTQNPDRCLKHRTSTTASLADRIGICTQIPIRAGTCTPAPTVTHRISVGSTVTIGYTRRARSRADTTTAPHRICVGSNVAISDATRNGPGPDASTAANWVRIGAHVGIGHSAGNTRRQGSRAADDPQQECPAAHRFP
jgi:hypothetical protein